MDSQCVMVFSTARPQIVRVHESLQIPRLGNQSISHRWQLSEISDYFWTRPLQFSDARGPNFGAGKAVLVRER